MENIEPAKKEPAKWTPPTLEQAEESDYKKYLEALSLTEEDLKDKEILDVGAGPAIFAKYAKEKGISDSIFSLDPEDEPQEKTKAVYAKVENLPYKDESFDMVMSSGAYPYVASIGETDSNIIEKKLKDGLNEMIRVVRSGSEIRLGPLGFSTAPDFKQVNDLFDDLLQDLIKKGKIEVEKVDKDDDFIPDSYMYIITKK
ncbi:class I SAM-dependent methyltransferase [Patescibacteria group bacterium]